MVFFSACRKEILKTEPCLQQTANPDKRSYSATDFTQTEYNNKHCGLLPLSKNHLWIYQDSIFENGLFARIEMDTLQFTTTWQTQPDGITWFKANKEVGLPLFCYSNDSAIFSIEQRLFSSPQIMDAKKQIFISHIDSIRYLSAFIDEAAIATQKMNSPISTALGNFNDCIFLEKLAPGYRKDQVYLKPGIGVVKYIYQEAPFSSPGIEMQRISTLVNYIIN